MTLFLFIIGSGVEEEEEEKMTREHVIKLQNINQKQYKCKDGTEEVVDRLISSIIALMYHVIK